jgi:UDP-glucose 4-epimerase
VRVLLTGFRGFVGSHVLPLLLADERVESLVLTTKGQPRQIDHKKVVKVEFAYLEQAWHVRRLFSFWDFDVIFHLAGNPSVRASGSDLNQANLLSTQFLLESCRESTTFVLASSATVYGCGPGPHCEDNLPRPASVYALTKLMAEDVLRLEAPKKGVRPLICRLVANVGANSTHGLLHDLVEKFRGNPHEVELIGEEPGSVKPYTWAGDTARALAEFALSGRSGTINISPPDQLSVKEVADLLSERLGKRKYVWRPDQTWGGDQKGLLVGNHKMAEWGFAPSFPSSRAAIERALSDILGETKEEAA